MTYSFKELFQTYIDSNKLFKSSFDGHWVCIKEQPPCTCGAVKAAEPYPATGHADYCDINNPPPDTEELPF